MLVTIGCPFDIVRTFWPRYFKDRERLEGTPKQWINIYSPIDVLGSNFRDDSETKEATAGIEFLQEGLRAIPANVPYGVGPRVGWRHVLTMNGLRAHGFYWQHQDDVEVSAFAPLIESVYSGSTVLR